MHRYGMSGRSIQGSILRRFLLVVFCALLLTSANSEESQYKTTVPVLTVQQRDQKLVGGLQNIEFSYRRLEGSDRPLRMSIVEDTPSGAGPSLRASAWLAAVMAALETKDPLGGVTLTFTLSGQVDGPSAGGVFCLSIMSALENREMPQDFAFTGSILPDGTIGRIAGIPQKIEAAAKAGKKRVLGPSCLEFEEDPNTGKMVDLLQYAKERGMEYVPVRDIESAYHEVHGTRARYRYLPNDIRLPRRVRDYYVSKYERSRADFERMNTGMALSEREGFQSLRIGSQVTGFATQAQASFVAGYVYPAASRMRLAEKCLVAWNTMKEFLDENRGYQETVFKRECDHESSRLFGSVPEPLAIYTKLRTKGVSRSGSYLASCILPKSDADAYDNMYDIYYELASASLTTSQTPGDESVDTEESLDPLRITVEKLFHANLLRLLAEEDIDEAMSLDSLVRDRNLTIQPAYKGIENLFYSAYLAVNNSFNVDTVPGLAEEHDLSQENMWLQLYLYDEDCMRSVHAAEHLNQLHERIREEKPENPEDPFLAAAATHLYIDGLADFGAPMVRWSELGAVMQEDTSVLTHKLFCIPGGGCLCSVSPAITVKVIACHDTSIAYSRSGVLHGMLRTARRNALAAIGECQSLRIPCIESILYFRSAEFSRDASGADKVNTLKDYWRASLHAKAQVMLFGKPKADKDSSSRE